MAEVGSPRSCASSVEDDSDAVNTDSARVYFGPLQSPEKKFAPHAKLRTPLRRSARFSHIPVKSLLLCGSSDEEDLHPDEGKRSPEVSDPDESMFYTDSAHIEPVTTPSEPHQVTTTEDSVAEPARRSAVLSDIGGVDPCSAERPRDGQEIVDEGGQSGLMSREGTPMHDDAPPDEYAVLEPSSLLASKILRAHDNPSPPPNLPDIGHYRSISPDSHIPVTYDNASQQDLINFNSFSFTSTSPHPITARADTEYHPTLTTVDDLLALSPVPNPDTTDVNRETTASVDEEDQVLVELSRDDSEPVPYLHDAVPIPEAVPDPVTPVRRSSQRQRSRSPLVPQEASLQDKQGSESNLKTPGLLVRKGKNREATREEGSSKTRESTVVANAQDLQIILLQTLISTDTKSIEKTREGVTMDNSIAKVDEDGPTFKIEQKRQGTQASFERELGSLSPTSAGLLMQLLPTASRSSDGDSTSSVAVEPIYTLSPPSSSCLPISLPSQSPRSPSPTRVSDTKGGPVTPSSPTFRTPARRIPIAQAIAQGMLSAQKHGSSSSTLFSKTTAGTGFPASPVFKRTALDDPARSPAKRIPVSEAMAMATPAKGKVPTRLGSPMRAFSRERSRSVEPKPPVIQKQRASSAEPTRPILALKVGRDGFFAKPRSSASDSDASTSTPTGNSSRPERARVILPFPIVAAPLLQPTIPEVEENDAESPVPPVGTSRLPLPSPSKSSPTKPSSSLRQPSASSRIPRIGAKPYARPKTQDTDAEKDTKLIVSARRAAGASTSTNAVAATRTAQPLRVMRLARGNGKSAEDYPSKHLASPSSKVSDPTNDKPDSTISAATSLKRKRDCERSKASPPGMPIVMMRKVMSGMFSHTSKSAPILAVTIPPNEQAQAEPSTIKGQGPIKMRRVVDWKKPRQFFWETAQKQPVEEENTLQQSFPDKQDNVPILHQSPRSPPHRSPTPIAGPSCESSLYTTSRESKVTSAEPPSPPQVEPSTTSDTRRSARSRRRVGRSSDVFGAIAATTVQPLQPRRKRPVVIEPSVFSGMSALALKALTTSNTTKNQQQMVALQTEVIRKEGLRPESPTTKVRTILDRQKEMKVQERKERAERRARRSAGEGTSEPDGSSDVGDFSILSVDVDGVPLRHRRGPGDEEDYETPDRYERPAKRGRTEADEAVKDERRVRWDRGLATMVYLDDSPLNPRKPPKGEPVMKGCLAHTAKAVRLDTLGNVVNADVPLTDLVHENVVVKKFVYDDDPAEDDPPQTPPPAPAAKVTRNKSKKSKS
ncbi:hypothetical protein SCP_0406860 [Sparassis crispa]|uniref:Uncharacterized protein n=1 Tax=Sparassis crispa TaxID=139825 RepID=A0A401GJG7_9APHY|nr:hypothetical protein SCP_0406860 [Sparassis crispa]GBE82302.1 hypothetical protein SCP_0406860 [Sparassis crispa]